MTMQKSSSIGGGPMKRKLAFLRTRQLALQERLKDLDEELESDPSGALRSLCRDAANVLRNTRLSRWERRSSLSRLNERRHIQERRLRGEEARHTLRKKRCLILEEPDLLAREIEHVQACG
jgi:hypothetical protein